MLFKVYAQNIVRPAGMRIMEADESDLKECFEEIFNEASNNELINILNDEEEVDDSKVDEAYRAIEKFWDSHHCISSGDYMIIEVESREEINIPSSCGNDAGIIF